MYTRFYPLGLALLLACPAYTHAQEAATSPTLNITLNNAVALALDNNPELSAARHELEAVDATVTQAGARPNPELSTLMEDTRKSTRTTTIQLNQPIELGGKRAARIGAPRG
uniref:TolC family protein n=1 Tax=Herbaspirillum lusitanum TaxID=213312 RepID=UPI00058E064B